MMKWIFFFISALRQLVTIYDLKVGDVQREKDYLQNVKHILHSTSFTYLRSEGDKMQIQKVTVSIF